ncbi:hypothetical protein GX563_06215 [Candidatus Bathyarchaeota archaeon]|nr:hypothetical protein [Candidatus Bathyarchaeota archaeon]
MKKLGGLRDIISNTKRRKPTQLFCPRCASSKIQLSSSLDVWLTPKQYYCPDCGYRGILVMELEPVEESEKETAPKDNTSGSTETQDRDQATEKE